MRELIRLFSGALEDAGLSWWRGGWRTVFGTAVVALALLPLGALVVVDANLRAELRRVESEVNLTVFGKNGLDAAAAATLRERLRVQPGVAAVTVVTPEAALERLKTVAPELYDSARELRQNPLPWSFEIALNPETRAPERLQGFMAALGKVEGVDAVDADIEWAKGIASLRGGMAAVGYAYALLLALSAIFTVGAVLKMTYLLKRDQVEIMRLVGATRVAVALPFFFEGSLIGAGGAALALAALKVGHLGLARSTNPLLLSAHGYLPRFLPPVGSLALLGAGVALGALGGLMTLGRSVQK